MVAYLSCATTASQTPSPWCKDPTHPAEVGMYGEMGFNVRLVNSTGQVPPNVVGLFRQGLAHLYGFNNVEALRNFQTAATQAPNCALCHWGIAVAFAPNINYFIENQTALNNAATAAVRFAKEQPHLSSKTHTLINAVAKLVAPKTYRWEALGPTKLLFNGTGGQEAVPSQGHLTHMPAHLFLRTGLYMDAVQTSRVSTGDNAKYLAKCLTPYGLGHNLKMYVANARFAGRLNDSLAHAARAQMPAAGQERTPNGGTTCVDCAGQGSPEYVLTLVRFGRWHDVLQQTVPTDFGSTSFATYNQAEWHVSRAAAYWALSDKGTNKTRVRLGDAEARIAERVAPSTTSPQGFNYTVIVPEELRAMRAFRVEHNWSQAIAHYANVVAADDANLYLEPPRMSYPPRQCLGALLAQAPSDAGGNSTAALGVFEDDLDHYVENAWSLYGAAEAALKLGRRAMSDDYRARADRAWKDADVAFVSPCPQLFG